MSAIEAAPWPSHEPTLTTSSTTDPTPIPAAPSLREVIVAAVTMGLVAVTAAMGSADGGVVVAAASAVVAPTLGALVLTAPALVAIHQFLGLHAPPQRLVVALARAFVASGRIALGLVPVALFFSATSGLWPLVLAGTMAITGVAMAAVALVELRSIETTALVMPPRFALLLVGWCALGVLIAIRIAFEVAVSVGGAVS